MRTSTTVKLFAVTAVGHAVGNMVSRAVLNGTLLDTLYVVAPERAARLERKLQQRREINAMERAVRRTSVQDDAAAKNGLGMQAFHDTGVYVNSLDPNELMESVRNDQGRLFSK